MNVCVCRRVPYNVKAFVMKNLYVSRQGIVLCLQEKCVVAERFIRNQEKQSSVLSGLTGLCCERNSIFTYPYIWESLEFCSTTKG